MITTIQIREQVKKRLDKYKESNRETYEQVILHLIHLAEHHKKQKKELLIEGYTEMAEDSLVIHKEWSAADAPWD